MQRKPAPVIAPCEHRFRQHCKSTAHTGEAAVLGKAAQFNCTLERTRNLENRMRNLRIRNVRLVRGIKEQKRIVFARVIDPACELRARRDGTGWIIREAKINEINV